uniref:Uncharacterized protein n=1 Tax=Ursus maritimus TaxID=29073 RepID=A0A452TIY1_URSMA
MGNVQVGQRTRAKSLSFCLCLSFSSRTSRRAKTFHVTVFHLPVALLEAFELGPALFGRPEEATLPQLLRHGPIQLALPVTGLESFVKPSLMEDIKKSLGFLVPPVHTCHGRKKFKDGRKVCSLET